jgi:hypothetical protein
VRPDFEEPAGKANVHETTALPYGPSIFIGVCIGAYLIHSWNG